MTQIPPPPIPTTDRKLRRSLQFALFAVSILWYMLADGLAGRAARGITNRFNLDDLQPLLAVLFLLFLLAVGFSAFQGIFLSRRRPLSEVLGLPGRATAGREWAIGAAIGWGMGIAAVLPMMLAGALHMQFWTQPRAFWLLLIRVLTLGVSSLAMETALRGFPFRRLIDALGPARATILLAILQGVVHYFTPDATWISMMVTMLASLLFSLAWLRTHGLWLPWGMHFAWNASVGLIFGLPLRGVSALASVVQTRAIGPLWLTGYDFGPEGAFLTMVVVLVAIVVLIRTTGDYAWLYTRPEILSGGYPVDPAPPAAHVQMEQEAATRPPALIQIAPATPPPPPRPGEPSEDSQ